MFSEVYFTLWSNKGAGGLISSGLAIIAELGRYLIGKAAGEPTAWLKW